MSQSNHSILSNLPRPKIQNADGSWSEGQGIMSEVSDEEHEHLTRGQIVLNQSLPWMISLVFHLAVLLLLLFFVWTYQVDATKITIPVIGDFSHSAGIPFTPTPDRPDFQPANNNRTVQARQAEGQAVDITSLENDDTPIIGMGSSLPGEPLTGIGSNLGPGSVTFVGVDAHARKVVFLIDRSGSMADTFDFVRNELMRSIAGLSPEQSYHVIFFSRGRAVENPPKRLIRATEDNKKRTYDFLDTIRAEGRTDPRQAIRRAFLVGGGPPDLVILLTDGEFDRELVRVIQRLNRTGGIRVSTISFIYRVGETLLKKIAQENGGTYKHVSSDEVEMSNF